MRRNEPTRFLVDDNVLRERNAGGSRDVAVVCMRDARGAFLFARTRRLPNHVTLIGGGIESTDDSPAAAAVREVLEELGLVVSESELVLTHTDRSDLDDGTVFFFETTHSIPRDLPAVGQEILGVMWVAPGDVLAQMLMPATRRYFEAQLPEWLRS